MPFASKRLLALIVLFVFSLIGTVVWTIIGNAYIKYLPGVKKITLKEFLLQLLIFYAFVLLIFFIVSAMFFRKYF